MILFVFFFIWHIVLVILSESEESARLFNREDPSEVSSG
jgi:preprotein translocase subunit SecG